MIVPIPAVIVADERSLGSPLNVLIYWTVKSLDWLSSTIDRDIYRIEITIIDVR